MKKLNNAKWFFLGVAVCVITAILASPAIASNLKKQATLNFMDIKITLDGKAIEPKDANGNYVEPFAIDGTTYLPVRGISSALGIDVSWDSKTSTVVLTSPGYNPNQSQYGRTNPAPIGTSQTIEVSNILEKHSVSITVLEVVRGDAAWQMIKAANQFNDEPEDGKEYILAKIKATVLSSENDKAVSFSAVSFTPFSSTSVEYDTAFVVDPDPKFSGNVYTGGTLEGYATFQVDINDTSPRIVYGEKYDGTGGIWFAIS